MIITRTWLNNFIDISGLSDEKLCEIFNSIGLEVDSVKKYEIPPNVVVGEVISCGKHPNADKLRVCQIDIGNGTIRQIVCGASNIVYAKFVAVARIGAELGENFEIRHTTIRGIDSEGMVCSASELGLPNIDKGIMILDDSIGELVVGKELREYDKVADTVIELELTANRGDCLSIYGVARDLSAVLNLSLNPLEYEYNSTRVKVGLARVLQLKSSGKIRGSLQYTMAEIEGIHTSTLCKLRLAFIQKYQNNDLKNILQYVIHTTGVVLRAYRTRDILIHDGDKILLTASTKDNITTVEGNGRKFSTLGVCQYEGTKTDDKSNTVLFEASYIDPKILVNSIAGKGFVCDELYYRTSRGSEPNLSNGIKFLTYMLEGYGGCNFFDGVISVEEEYEPKIITVNREKISQIIGKRIEKPTILTILKGLGFRVQNTLDDTFGVTVPKFRHDIENMYDIAEEVLRIIGIDNVEAKPLKFVEATRTNQTVKRYYAKRALRERAVASSFYETVSYAFSDRGLLKKYGFPVVKEELDIINPITEDMNTLRSTILINMLHATKRNISYSQKSIALFEIGTVFDENRNGREVLSLIFSGQRESENVSNAGKPKNIDFESFTKKVASIIGDFELRAGTRECGIVHPYQSADIIIRNEVCGFISKLHPTVMEEFGLPTTFIAEISFDALIPQHINAVSISKFQGAYKDLSLVIDKNMPYNQVAMAIKQLHLPLLKQYYPIDVYQDESLGDNKSLTIRLFIQSVDGTLKDKEIEETVQKIVKTLEEQYGASLR